MASGIRPIVLTGPSGTGKSTIFERARREFPDAFAFSVSHTTRAPRNGEIAGKHYYFVTKDTMQQMIDDGQFVEWAEFGGNRYGTSKQAIREIQDTGRICVLDLELQGVREMKRQGFPAKYILIRAPSLEVLKQRLLARGTETEESIARRLKHAIEDDSAAQQDPHLFDKVIVNDDLETAYKEFLDAIKDELDAYRTHKSNGLNGHSN